LRFGKKGSSGSGSSILSSAAQYARKSGPPSKDMFDHITTKMIENMFETTAQDKAIKEGITTVKGLQDPSYHATVVSKLLCKAIEAGAAKQQTVCVKFIHSMTIASMLNQKGLLTALEKLGGKRMEKLEEENRSARKMAESIIAQCYEKELLADTVFVGEEKNDTVAQLAPKTAAKVDAKIKAENAPKVDLDAMVSALVTGSARGEELVGEAKKLFTEAGGAKPAPEALFRAVIEQEGLDKEVGWAEDDTFGVLLGAIIAAKPVKEQLPVLFTIQGIWMEKGAEKGVLEAVFMKLYDEDIVEHEVFDAWKEDTEDETDGKMKAIFELNAWLNWLETASDDDSSDEDSDEE
jgi:hypothetical protein